MNIALLIKYNAINIQHIHVNIQVGNIFLHPLIHILLVLMFLYLMQQVLCLYNYAMTLTNTSNISRIFEFINISNNQSGNNINVKTISYRTIAIFIIIGSIGIIIWSFISVSNTIYEASKKLSKITIAQEEHMQLAINENYHNLPNSCSCNNAYHYISDPIEIMKTGIKGYDVIGYDVQQSHLNVILFYVYVFDILRNGFEKENRSLFEFENKNLERGDFVMECAFDNGFDCDTPSPLITSSSLLCLYNNI